MLQDLRNAWRLLLRNRGFSLLAVATLAIGIGATTTIFSLLHGVLLKPLPFDDSDRLVSVQTDRFAASAGDYLDWKAKNRVFTAMAGFTGGTFSMTGVGDPERLFAATVTPEFFDALGVRPQIGSTFSSLGVQSAPSDTALISARLWRRRFQADPAVIGKAVTLDGRPFTVIGVAPEGFTFPRDLLGSWGNRMIEPIDLWVPLELRPGDRQNAFLQVIARLRPGVSEQQAAAELMSMVDAPVPADARGGRRTITVVRVQEQIVRGVRPILSILSGAVGLLLLVACTNVANLLASRAEMRRREVAIRSALGSGRGRLIRQFLTESVVLALPAGAVGVLLAAWALRIAPAVIPAGSLPRLAEARIDGVVLAFAVATSVLTGLLFGVLPAVQSSNRDVATVLKNAAAAQTPRARPLKMLVVAEVAVTFVLATGAALLFESFLRLAGTDPGFHPDRTLTASVSLSDRGYPTSPQIRTFVATVIDRLRPLPGVDAAAAVNWLPLGRALIMGDFSAEDLPSTGLVVAKPSVSPEYFKAMGVPVLSGRAFDDRDTERSAPVAIVSDVLARQVWPGEPALGKRIRIGIGNQQWVSIVGVVGDVKQNALAERPRPTIYTPIDQAPASFLLRNLTFVVRSAAAPASLAPVIRREIRAVDPLLPFDRVQTMDQLVADSVAEPRFRAFAFTAFATTALVLVAIGVLGVLGYSVARRTREIGVRLALGAARGDMLKLVVREALALTVAGIGVGAVASFLLTRVLTRFLFGVHAAEPTAFVVAAVLLVIVGTIGGLVPAIRATRVEPLVALRQE